MIVPSTFIKCFYIGINAENILYGIVLGLYMKTTGVLLANTEIPRSSRLFYAFFNSVMLCLISVWISSQAVFGLNMWLLNPNYPGGADAYWRANIGVWYMDLATTTVIVLQLMTDALMIHRCRIIWSGSNSVVVVPIILWLATLTLGVLVAWSTSLPGCDYYTGAGAHFSLAYWTISVFLNTTLTSMICYRMVQHGRNVQEHLGQEYATWYFRFVTTVIESVLPYTLSGISFLVSLGVGSPTSTIFIFVYVLMMCISPQMLILRVVEGKAWDNDTFSRAESSIEFSPTNDLGSGSQYSNNSAAEVHLQTLSDTYYLPDRRDEAGICQV